MRACGPCTACCTTMGVPSIEKEIGCRCPHLQQSKCSIYADRPGECRDFECLWLQGEGKIPNELRPDKVKAILSAGGGNLHILTVAVLPQHKGAHRKSPLREYLEEISQRVPVFILCGEERTAYGPRAAEIVNLLQLDRGTGPLVQLKGQR